MPFNIGEKVIMTERSPYTFTTPGSIGVVTDIARNGTLTIFFFKFTYRVDRPIYLSLEEPYSYSSLDPKYCRLFSEEPPSPLPP